MIKMDYDNITSEEEKKDLLKYYKFVIQCSVDKTHGWFGTDDKKEGKNGKGICPKCLEVLRDSGKLNKLSSENGYKDLNRAK